MNFYEALSGLRGEHEAASRGLIFGVVVGIVTNNKDPDGLGRVKLQFPWLSDSDESDWARVASVGAGKQRGAWFLPEVEDEVLVAFEHGNPRRPFVLGGLWNGQDKPPADSGDVREIRSRSGHVIRLSDKDGSEKIEIIDKTGDNLVSLDSARNEITIAAPQGSIKLKAQSIEIEASGKTVIKGASVDIN